MEEDQMDVVPLPNNHDAVFNIKIGDRRSRSFMPDFKDSGINFSINEGLNVLRAKFVHQTMPFVERWNSDRKKKDLLVFGDEVDIVVVTGHQLSAVLPRQTSWIALDPTAFHEQLRQIWNKVASSTVIPVSVKRNNPEEVLRLKTDRMESFAFHFYFFIPTRKKDFANNRPTIERTENALSRIHERLNAPNAPSVSINGRAIRHWAEHLARNPAQPVDPPDDMTFFQLQHVDSVCDQIQEQNNHEENVLLSVEIGGAWTKLKFKKAELRSAVGLPDFDLKDIDFLKTYIEGIRPTDGNRNDDEHELEENE